MIMFNGMIKWIRFYVGELLVKIIYVVLVELIF